jgi:predicted peptidase
MSNVEVEIRRIQRDAEGWVHMIRHASLALAVTLFVGARVSSQETGFLDRKIEKNKETYRYSVYVPSDYRGDKRWPLLVDLHGGGAQGDDGIRQTAHFLAHEIRMNRKRFPLLVLFPQAARGTGWNPEVIMAEIDQTLRDFRVDAGRIYLTGFSMGGAGVYDTAAQWPNKFAAVIAIAGPVPAETSELVKGLRRVPIRIMHGVLDKRVPVEGSRRLVAHLRKAGASVEYVEDPENGHDGEKPYSDPEMIDWLLAHHR